MSDPFEKYTKRQLAEIIVDLVGNKRSWDLRDECSLSTAQCEEIISIRSNLKAVLRK